MQEPSQRFVSPCLALVCLCSLGLHTGCVPQRAQWHPELPHTHTRTQSCLFIRGRGVKSNGMGKKKNKDQDVGRDEREEGRAGNAPISLLLVYILF